MDMPGCPWYGHRYGHGGTPMATVKLTDAIVRTLPTPPKANKVYYDAVGPAGFGARVTANGSRSFIYNYRTRATGRERRITIGEISELEHW